ncbi:SCAN domain-containing protein 3, partial [Stegodyphus mimosarum]
MVIHCVIHRQHLVAKKLSPRLHKSLQYVINAINKIRSNSLNSRLFAQLCEENDEVFTRLLLHIEVRWLSRGSCLERFSAIFEYVLEFLQEKDSYLKENLNNCKTDIYYLTDIFGMFNKVNFQLQGDDLNLIKTKSIISAFVGRKDYSQFPHLSKLPEMLQDDDILLYVTHLDALHKDFTERFEDLLNLQIPQWIINPYNTTAIEEANVITQEEFITISTDEELKQKFNQGYQKFWLQRNIETQYPTLWNIAEKYHIAFPSSYLVEKSFSVVTNILKKQRNRFKINQRGDLRLQLTNIEPDVARLVDSHQVHPSH